MESNITYYIAILALIVIGFFVVRKVASCLIKSAVTIVLIVLMVAIYWLYLRG
ncbi:MAG: sulfate transporter [Prevotella sp.]|nr:sulfate transporter [Prevotella sp.]